MSKYQSEPADERVYKSRRPYEFGSIDLVPGGFKIAPARVESQYPNMFRAAQYPDGKVRIQGAYAWSEGSDGGVVWRDLPMVKVDNSGQEVKDDC